MTGSSGRAAGAEPGRVVSVNVGVSRPVTWRNRTVHTAIFKYPVEGRVPALGVNLISDDQVDREVHGGPDKAVYAYAREDLDWWAGELGRRLDTGVLGENLTVTKTAVTDAVIGERWRIGTVELEVCAPRAPCYKLGIRMGDDDHGVTVGAVAHAFHRDHARAPEILAAPELAEVWRSWAQRLLDRDLRRPGARSARRGQGDAP